MSEDTTPHNVNREPANRNHSPIPLEDLQVIAHYPADYISRGGLIGGIGTAVLTLLGSGPDLEAQVWGLLAGGFLGGLVGFIAMIFVGEFRYVEWRNKQRDRNEA
ncbi:MAG: hypothetical protein M0R73_00980 [Dehalococcoidia bacterium]|nr:hypothetical protein [Dehalococcoidia bacterium]